MSLKLFISCLLLTAFPFLCEAQYYYQDICNARQTMQDHREYRKNGIRHIRIRSYDPDHSLNKGFHCVKKISDDFKQVRTETASFQTGNSTIISTFDDSGRIMHTVDSTSMSVNDTYYYYDPRDNRRIDSIRFYSYSVTGRDTFRFHEVHVYQYDGQGRLDKMLRRKNDKLYSEVTFRTDSLGQVISESEKGRYDTVPTKYYKYDSRGNLTDIYHYSPGRGRLEPDYLFDYDRQGRLAEKTTVTMNTNNYLLWKYFYNDKGLVSREECYGKKHALLGLLEFDYE